jgi:hypothetical protein
MIKWREQEIPNDNEQNKKYHIIKWTKQEIPHDTMNKTRNTI